MTQDEVAAIKLYCQALCKELICDALGQDSLSETVVRREAEKYLDMVTEDIK